jgi:hypothetical protein
MATRSALRPLICNGEREPASDPGLDGRVTNPANVIKSTSGT